MKKYISVCMAAFLLLGIFQINVMAAGEINIISPAAEVYSDIEEFKVDCIGADKIIFELDGVKIGETDGETILNLQDGELSVGNHSLKVFAIFHDKTAATDEISFNVNKLIATDNKYTENFNSYEAGSEAAVGITHTSQSGKTKVQPTIGQSGLDGDKAFYMKYAIDKHTSSSAPYINFSKFSDYGAGITSFKFAMKMDDPSTAWLRQTNMPSWNDNGADNFIQNGKFVATDTAVSSSGWMDVEIVLNYYKSTILFKVNDSILYNDTWKTTNSSSRLRFTLLQNGTREESTRTGLSLDNINFKQELSYGLDNILYGDDNSWTSCGGTLIPADTPKLKLVLTEALDPATVSKDSISVYQNGAAIPVSDAVYNEDDKSIVLTPSQNFDKGSEIVVKLAGTIKLSGAEEAVGTTLEARVMTELPSLTPSAVGFKKGGSPLISGEQLETADTVSVDLTLNNDTSEPKKMAAIVSVIQNGKMRSVGAVEHTLAPGTTKPVTVSLPPLAALDGTGDVSVKLIVCNGLGTTVPYMTYTEVK